MAKKFKFRVLVGHHAIDIPNDDGTVRTERYGPGAKKLADYCGDVIETDSDLVAKFNRPGSIKFERVECDPDTPESLQSKIDELRMKKAALEEANA